MLFYDDNFTSMIGGAVERIVKSGGEISVEDIDSGLTYFKDGSYLLPSQNPLNPENIYEAESSAVLFEKTTVFETPYALMFQYPDEDDAFTQYISSYFANSRENYKKSDFFAGVIDNGSDVVDVISRTDTVVGGAWEPALYYTYHITFKGRMISLTVLCRPLGGIGVWLPDVLKKKAEAAFPSFVVNTGHADFLGSSTGAISGYYRDSGVDILAFDGSDAVQLKPFLFEADSSSFLSPGVDLLCSNLGAAQPARWKKYVVKEINGVKIGFYSLIGALPLRDAEELGLSVRDYFEAGNETLEILKNKEKTDFNILISHLNPAEQGRYLSVAPPDLVIEGSARTSFASRVSAVNTGNWRYDNVMTASRSRLNLGELDLRFDKEGSLYVFKGVDEKTGANSPSAMMVDNKYYPLNKYKLEALVSGSQKLLPDSRRLWGTPLYSSLNIANLAANVLRDYAEAEVAFVKIGRPPDVMGDISERNIAVWLSGEPVYIGYVKGKYLKELVKFVDFSETAGADSAVYGEVNRLASSGLTANASIANIPIDNDETYKIAFPEDALKGRRVFSAFNNVYNIKRLPGQGLSGVVIEWLKNAAKDRDAYADGAYADYIRGKGILAAGDQELAKLYAQGKFSLLYDRFLDAAADKYSGDLKNMLRHRDDVRPFVRLNLRKLAMRFSDAQVSNSDVYTGFSNAKLNSNSQMLVEGALDFYVEYFLNNFRWDNGVSASYGKVTIFPSAGGSVTNESADDLLFQSELVYKKYKVDNFMGGFLAGPFLSLAYDTEFSPQPQAATQKIIRAKGGLKLYQGANIKDLYLAGVSEQDYTYAPSRRKYAWETGFQVEHYPVPNIKMKYLGGYRNFFRNSTDLPTDLLYELQLNASAEIDFIGNLKLAPYFDFYQARGKFTDVAGRNVTFGFSLTYSFIYKPFIYH